MDRQEHTNRDKYFRVCVPRGHVGAGRSQEIVFYIKAADIYSATKQAMRMPGIKHSQYVSSAKEVTMEEYIDGRQVSAYKKYIGNLA